MSVNRTDNSFRHLPWYGKLRRIVLEPDKTATAISAAALSLVGQRQYLPFLILTRDRTGSNMLVQYLNSHRQISCAYEVLGKLEGRSGPDLIRRIYGRQPFFIRARGFKVFYYHPMDADGTSTWDALVAIPNLRLIHLIRDNILETAVSSKLAYLTGLYGDLGNSPKAISNQVEPFEYPVEKLLSVFEQTRGWETDGLRRFSHCPQLELSYEQLVADPSHHIGRICRFLGISQPFTPRTSFRKQRQKSIKAILSNYDALKAHFSGTQWASFFTE
jgi:LPS sulfotransferase NodH